MFAPKTPKGKDQPAANAVATKQAGDDAMLQFVDNRPEASVQRKFQTIADRSPIRTLDGPRSNFSVSGAVVQRDILVGDVWKKQYDDALVSEQVVKVKPYIVQWSQLDTIFDGGTKTKTSKAKEAYLNNAQQLGLENDIRVLLRKYVGKNSFENDEDLARQLIQDVKLKLLGMESILGTSQRDGQFSAKDDDSEVGRTGKSKTLRIYRTMKAEHWNNYKKSGDVKDILWGHGGSLGQALHYFLKSKQDKLPDVLVEFEFSGKAESLVDYKNIGSGGEGKEPKEGKLTGKKEQNDVMDLDQEIFSINLGKSKDLIAKLNPKVNLLDQVQG